MASSSTPASFSNRHTASIGGVLYTLTVNDSLVNSANELSPEKGTSISEMPSVFISVVGVTEDGNPETLSLYPPITLCIDELYGNGGAALPTLLCSKIFFCANESLSQRSQPNAALTPSSYTFTARLTRHEKNLRVLCKEQEWDDAGVQRKIFTQGFSQDFSGHLKPSAPS